VSGFYIIIFSSRILPVERKLCYEKFKAYLGAGRATEASGWPGRPVPLSGPGLVGVKVGGGGSDRHALKSFWDLHYLARTTYVCEESTVAFIWLYEMKLLLN